MLVCGHCWHICMIVFAKSGMWSQREGVCAKGVIFLRQSRSRPDLFWRGRCLFPWRDSSLTGCTPPSPVPQQHLSSSARSPGNETRSEGGRPAVRCIASNTLLLVYEELDRQQMEIFERPSFIKMLMWRLFPTLGCR